MKTKVRSFLTRVALRTLKAKNDEEMIIILDEEEEVLLSKLSELKIPDASIFKTSDDMEFTVESEAKLHEARLRFEDWFIAGAKLAPNQDFLDLSDWLFDGNNEAK